MSRDAHGRSLHVLMVPSFYATRERPYSGTFFRDWATALQRTGVRVGIAYVEGRSLRGLSIGALRESRFQVTAQVEDGLPTVRLRGWNTLAQWTPGGLIWARLMRRAIREYISRHGRPDLVAAQSATWAGDAAWRARRMWGLPYVVTEVNTGFGTGRVRGWEAAVSRRAFSGAEAVIAISQNLRGRLVALAGTRRIEVIPCTVDETYWTPGGGSRPAQGPFTFYAQAHLSRRKGFDILIRAFARAFHADPDVCLVIGGGGPIRQDLEDLARACGVGSRVTFLGSISRDAVRDAMRAADCFVLPSLEENFGVVLIEALSTGLPVIATRCGGPEDFVDQRVGILLQPGDEAGLSEALTVMRCGRVFDRQLVREYATEQFGHAVVGARLRDLYREVLM